MLTAHREGIDRLELPVHFFIGAHDPTALPALSRDLFEMLHPPEKSYHPFEHTAHSPLFEEPD